MGPKLKYTEQDMAVAKRLADAGWSQCSHRYRQLGRVPGGGSAAYWMRFHEPAMFERMRDLAMARLESDCRQYIFHFSEEKINLTEGEFEAWLALQRQKGNRVP